MASKSAGMLFHVERMKVGEQGKATNPGDVSRGTKDIDQVSAGGGGD
jgi:hypothetical protein